MALIKNKPDLVIKAIAQSNNPEAKRSLTWTMIELLNKRLSQIESDIKYSQEQHRRVVEMRNNLLDNFPEGDELVRGQDGN